MARAYTKTDAIGEQARWRANVSTVCAAVSVAALMLATTSYAEALGPHGLFVLAGLIPGVALTAVLALQLKHAWVERERKRESDRRNGAKVLGSPPDRTAFQRALYDARQRGKVMIDRYLVGFELDSGKPIWVTDEEICGHGAVFAKTGFGKTLWLEGLMFQQMARGRASGFTFIDAKRDPGTLADIILMALLTGRIEDLIVVDPFDPVCAYNFVFTTQRADVKARKVLRCGLPPTSDASTTKHYDRLAADAVYRMVRAMESFGLAWSVRDIAVALSAFQVAYPRMRQLLHESGSKSAMVELGHLASTYRTAKGSLDSARLTDNLRGIASELHSISSSEAGEMFCIPRADLSLTDAILRGKMVYYMLPRLEEAESAARMVKVFREDLEVSIGEVTSSRLHKLEDPHLVIIDEGASTFGPTWANLFELARKGRFALIFGAQSVGGLMDQTMGLSEEFYERVMANVNLKVIMRVGDNRTAEDMSEWMGM
ncbi:MAG: TraM recognition domain-containing protein, partial [Deltaproteobacteria bacterium]|nr:TraM recognition domain-containing protein [Deltaproteobacteria bacterium]